MMAASITYSTSSSFQELLIGRVLQGAGAAYFISPSIAAVATAASEKAGTALGVRSMLISLASIVAPPIAGVVVDSVGYLPVFAIAASLTGVLAVLNVFEAKRSITARRAGGIPGAGWREALNKIVIMMMLAALFNGVLFLSLSGVLQAHYRDLGYEAKTYGYYLMFFGLSSTVSRYIAGKLSTQKNPAAIALVGHATAVLAVYMLKEMYLAPSSYIVALVYGFGMGLTVPTQQLIVTSSVPEEVRNRAISIYAMGYDLGGFIGPMVYGYIASAYGYNASYQYMVLIPLAALMLMTYLTLKVSRGRR